MSNLVLKIERLDSGKFLATMTGVKYGRICDTVLEAARWAEKELAALRYRPEGPGPAK